MKKLADISAFESLATTSVSSVNNSSGRVRVRNHVFSKGEEGDIDRELLKKRGILLLKEGVSILLNLGVRGSTIGALVAGSTVRGASRIPKAIDESIRGTDSDRFPNWTDKVDRYGRAFDAVSFLPYMLRKTGSTALSDWTDREKEAISELRQWKAKEQSNIKR